MLLPRYRQVETCTKPYPREARTGGQVYIALRPAVASCAKSWPAPATRGDPRIRRGTRSASPSALQTAMTRGDPVATSDSPDDHRVDPRTKGDDTATTATGGCGRPRSPRDAREYPCLRSPAADTIRLHEVIPSTGAPLYGRGARIQRQGHPTVWRFQESCITRRVMARFDNPWRAKSTSLRPQTDSLPPASQSGLPPGARYSVAAIGSGESRKRPVVR